VVIYIAFHDTATCHEAIEALVNMCSNKILLHSQVKLLVVVLDTYKKDFSSFLPLWLMSYHKQVGVIHTARKAAESHINKTAMLPRKLYKMHFYGFVSRYY